MKKLYYVISIIGFILGLYLIIKGHRMVGTSGLMLMLAGLVGLLGNLYCYNRRHR